MYNDLVHHLKEALDQPTVAKELWFQTVQGQDVQIVDGEEIRNDVDVEFTEGGNPYRYDFIPADEIWIERYPDVNEMIFTVVHEWVEEQKMVTGVDYDSAHSVASKVESRCRANPDLLQNMMELIGIPKEGQEKRT